jgi:hypothetical protein
MRWELENAAVQQNILKVIWELRSEMDERR